MKNVMSEEVFKRIAQSGIVAVLQIDKVESAVPVAQALVAGGITAIELALRTDAAEPSIPLICKKVPEMTVGIGTVILSGQAKRVKEAGAAFAVSPGLNPSIVKEAQSCGLDFAPGVATAGEIEAAYGLGCTFLKLFPAVPLGGLSYLKSVAAPYKHLGLKYFPLGGVSEETLADFAALPDVAAIGGTWIASRDLITEQAWDEIEKRAKRAVEIWKKAKDVLCAKNRQ